MFFMAISDYAGELPASQIALNIALPGFVAAIVDDESARREVLEFVNEVLAS
jgi:hypothetical protein